MHINKSNRPSLLYIEYKSRDLSRRNSRISQNDTIRRIQIINLYNSPLQLRRQIEQWGAIQDQMCLQEQAQMVIEDLNGKLLQRAELIGQVEELEELIEYHKFKIDKLESQIQQLKKQSSFKLTDSTADLIRDREIKHKELKEEYTKRLIIVLCNSILNNGDNNL